MKDTTTTEYFQLIKGYVERTLDRNGWPWSMADSLFIDWCLMNMEGTNGN